MRGERAFPRLSKAHQTNGKYVDTRNDYCAKVLVDRKDSNDFPYTLLLRETARGVIAKGIWLNYCVLVRNSSSLEVEDRATRHRGSRILFLGVVVPLMGSVTFYYVCDEP